MESARQSAQQQSALLWDLLMEPRLALCSALSWTLWLASLASLASLAPTLTSMMRPLHPFLLHPFLLVQFYQRGQLQQVQWHYRLHLRQHWRQRAWFPVPVE